MPLPTKKTPRATALRILERLARAYPSATTALHYRNAYELLVAVILSAQCTDARVNLVTPELFARYPDVRSLAAADPRDVERIIRSCGFFRTKARNLVAAARVIAERHGGSVPANREELEALPGVGRKTASVVLAVAFEHPALAVDTHVFRVARRLGLSLGTTPLAVERDLTRLLPPEEWRHAHHRLILHGRTTCKAVRPLCERCPVRPDCPAYALSLKTATARVRATPREAATRRREPGAATATTASAASRTRRRSKATKG